MEVNLDKTKIVVFRNGGCLRNNEQWFYRDRLIEIVSMYTYLGIYMTPKLSWSRTHENAAKQAYKSINSIFRYQQAFGQFRPSEMLKLFASMVKPILCYGVELWGYQYIEKLENVHLHFCKRYCALPPQTATVFVYGECGRLPLCITYFIQCIKYWIKITRMDADRYPLQCYRMLKGLDDAGRKTWASNIRHFLFLVWV